MKLVIVESPTKAKTISKFLGKEYVVESSFGHIRDLPKSEMGIDIEHDFAPRYIVPKKSQVQATKLKKEAKKADEIILATDADREGEAIAWHLAQILNGGAKKMKRIVFHEITKDAINEALEHPRSIDANLVDAQQARRILDRLVGYELSPLLWKKVARGLSAGRVQSVALRMIVDREREIEAFRAEEYWTIEGDFAKVGGTEKVRAKLFEADGKKLDKLSLGSENEAKRVVENLKNASYRLADILSKNLKKTPPPPFTTSTLQQDGSNKLGFSAKKTMVIAQQLYEGIDVPGEGHVGLITYMRTDSLNLSQKFLEECQGYLRTTFGNEYALPTPRHYKTKSKGAQEAHEAIRPTLLSRNPEEMRGSLTPDQAKLYGLIWKRALASQMPQAILDSTTLHIEDEKKFCAFRATGSVVRFDGYLKVSGSDKKETLLPAFQKGDALSCEMLLPEQHFTEPPARFTDATLVKALEEYGIGRPSTYAPTLSTIIDRGYVEREEKRKLKPAQIGFLVTDLLIEHFPQIVDYQFTASLEANLDEVANGEKEWQPVIGDFYFPFHKNLEEKTKEISKEKTVGMRELGKNPATGKPVYVRIGRFGPFVQEGSKDDVEKPRFASLGKTMRPDAITLEEALRLLSLPKTVGQDEKGEDITVNLGRFGPYVQIGKERYPVKNADPYTLTLEDAKRIAEEGRLQKEKKTLRTFEGSDITILQGPYGPYITNGKKNARMPKDKTPGDLTLEECAELIEKAPEKRRGRFRKKKTE